MKVKKFRFIFFFGFIIFLLARPLSRQGLLPFPGDLLVSEYSPWSHSSFLGYLPGTYPSKAQYFDVLRQLYPWRTLSLKIFASGQWPLWNPHNFSGSPLLANFQSSFFYPLNLVYLLFSQPVAWTVLILSQTFLAGIFTFLLAREIKISLYGSLLAGTAFSLSGPMIVFWEYGNIGHTILWLPLCAYLLLKCIRDFQWLTALGFVLTLSFSFLAGHLPSFGYIFLWLCAWSLFLFYQDKRSLKSKLFLGGKILVLVGLFLGLVAFQLMPTLELIGQSARVAHEPNFLVEKMLFQPAQLLTFWIPDYFGNPAVRNYQLADTYASKMAYVGLVPMLLVLAAVFGRWKKREIRFLVIFSLLLLLLVVRLPFSRFLYSLSLPLISTSSPTNLLFLLSFNLSILAGYGWSVWFRRNNAWRIRVIAVTALVFLIGLMLISLGPGVEVGENWAAVAKRNWLYSLVVFIAMAGMTLVSSFKIIPGRKKFFIVGLLTLTLFDQLYFFRKFNPFVPSALIYPETKIGSWLRQNTGYDRFWGYGSAHIQANFATQMGIFSPEGYDPLYPKAYGEFLYLSREGNFPESFDRTTRSDAVIVRGFGREYLATNHFRKKILDLLGVKYVLDRVENGSDQQTFPPNQYRLVYDADGWRVFENLSVLPRAFLVGNYQIYRGPQEFAEKFFQDNFQPARSVLLEDQPGLSISQDDSSEAEILSYRPNELEVLTRSRENQLLFLSDTAYPGWQAFIDHQSVPVMKANYIFRAVEVPAGEHLVNFVYRPRSFFLGVKIFLVSFGAIIVFFISRICLKERKS